METLCRVPTNEYQTGTWWKLPDAAIDPIKFDDMATYVTLNFQPIMITVMFT
jgi:hypothetical protein